MSKDTIYRQAAIDIVRNRVKKYTTLCVLAVTDIQQLPSADVQPVVHGEWIKTMEGNAFRDKCSECESLYPNAFGYNWCPNCGAKMDGKGEDNGTDKR